MNLSFLFLIFCQPTFSLVSLWFKPPFWEGHTGHSVKLPRFSELDRGRSDRCLEQHFLGGAFRNIFYFHPYLGKIPKLTSIVQRVWNHQLVFFFRPLLIVTSKWAFWMTIRSKWRTRWALSTKQFFVGNKKRLANMNALRIQVCPKNPIVGMGLGPSNLL